MSAAELQQIADMRQQLDSAIKELSIQFQRIAQIQAQLDKLMGIFTKA